MDVRFNKVVFLVLFSGIIFIFNSCNSNRFNKNVEDQHYDIKIHRFENDLMEIKWENIDSEIKSLKQDYGRFLDLFGAKIIGIGTSTQPTFKEYLQKFLTDYMVNEVYNEVKVKFEDLSWLEADFNKAFNYYHHYFPEKPIPKVITFISGYNHSIAIDDSLIGIGLDKYMGFEHKNYTKLGIESYIRRNMKPEKILSDCFRTWAITEYPYFDAVDNVLTNILYHGSTYYFTKCILPDTDESSLFGFTEEQLKFCEKNEEQMWLYLIENKILFSTDMLTINKYVGEAPYTKGFTNESPGRAAIWLGFNIIKSYMKNNPDVTLDGLLKTRNYQQVLTLSKYKP